MMKWTITCIVGSFVALLNAQSITPQVLASAGASMRAGNVFVEWTLGEMATETYRTANLVITQGFHQPNLVRVSSQDAHLANISVYPNPTADVAIIYNPEGKSVEVQLLNMSGQAIYMRQFNHINHPIDLHNLPAGPYILQLRSGQSRANFTIEKMH